MRFDTKFQMDSKNETNNVWTYTDFTDISIYRCRDYHLNSIWRLGRHARNIILSAQIDRMYKIFQMKDCQFSPTIADISIILSDEFP